MGNIGASRKHYEVLPVGQVTAPEPADLARTARRDDTRSDSGREDPRPGDDKR